MRSVLLSFLGLTVGIATATPGQAATTQPNQGGTNPAYIQPIVRGALNPYTCESSDPQDEASANAININPKQIVGNLAPVRGKRFYDLQTIDHKHNGNVASGVIWQNANVPLDPNIWFSICSKKIGCEIPYTIYLVGRDSNNLPTTVALPGFGGDLGIGTDDISYLGIQLQAGQDQVSVPVIVTSVIVSVTDTTPGSCGAEFYIGNLAFFDAVDDETPTKIYIPQSQVSPYTGSCPDPALGR